MSVDTLEDVQRYAEESRSGPAIHAGLQGPRDGGVAKVVLCAVRDARVLEGGGPGTPELSAAVTAHVNDEPGTVAFPPAKVRQQRARDRNGRRAFLRREASLVEMGMIEFLLVLRPTDVFRPPVGGWVRRLTHLKSSIGGSVRRKLPRVAQDLNAILAYFTPADNRCVGH